MRVEESQLIGMSQIIYEQAQKSNKHIIITDEFIADFQKNILSSLKEEEVNNLVQILNHFVGKDLMLLVKWLYTLNSTKEISLHTIVINNTDDCDKIKDLPQDQISLEIDLKNLDVGTLGKLKNSINAQKTPIHHIMFHNVDPEKHKEFIENLYNVELLQIDDKNTRDLANNTTYKNLLIRQLAIEPKDGIDLWKEIIKVWAAKAKVNLIIPPNTIENYLTIQKNRVQNLINNELQNNINRLNAALEDCAIRGLPNNIFYNKFLEHHESLNLDLIIRPELTNEDIRTFAVSLSKNPHAKLKKLNITIACDVDLNDLLKALQEKTIEELEVNIIKKDGLIFDEKAFISKLEPIIGLVNYNIDFSYDGKRLSQENESKHPYNIWSRSDLKQKIAYNIARKNFSKLKERLQLSSASSNTLPSLSTASNQDTYDSSEIEVTEDFGLEINAVNENTNEAQQENQYTAEVIFELEVEANQNLSFDRNALTKYEGELVTYGKFIQDGKDLNYNFEGRIIHHEVFGNLPNAVKYFSPEAARYFRKNGNAFDTFNLSSPPAGCSLYRTELGELVLHYDKNILSTNNDPFIPKPLWMSPTTYLKPKYTYYVSDANLTEISTYLKEIDPKNHSKIYDTYIDNYGQRERIGAIFDYFGIDGIKTFLQAIVDLNKRHPGMEEFLYDSYFKHFSNWDVFLNDLHFFDSLRRINQMDEAELNLFKKFLKNCGASQHNLKHTLDAFDKFCFEFKKLEKKANVNCFHELANKNWGLPIWDKNTSEEAKGGAPCVYMERLLTILQNAKDFKEQFDLLDGLILDNYGAYYASKYEGFKVVSSAMKLHYNISVEREKPFNPNLELYKTSLNEIHKWSDNNTNNQTIQAQQNEFIKKQKEELLSYISRYLAQQESSMPLSEFLNLYNTENGLNSLANPNQLIVFLYLISHKRFNSINDELLGSKEEVLQNLIDTLKNGGDVGVVGSIIEKFQALYNSGFYINEREGLMILNFILQFSYKDTNIISNNEILRHIPDLPNLVLNSLEEYKYGMLKLIQQIGYDKYSWVKMCFIMSTNEFLTSKYPNLQLAYKDDLLLFSKFLSSDPNTAYFKERPEEYIFVENTFDNNDLKKWDERARKHPNLKCKITTSEIESKLDLIGKLLSKAAESTKPNNLDYAFRMIMNANEDFSYDKLIGAFEKINEIENFEPGKVAEILTQRGFTITAKVPELLRHDNEEIRTSLLSILMMLDALSQIKSEFFSTILKASSLIKPALNALVAFQKGADTSVIQEKFKSIGADLEKVAESSEIGAFSNILLTIALNNKEKYEGFTTKSIKEIQEEFNKIWSENGFIFSGALSPIVNIALDYIKSDMIKAQINRIEPAWLGSILSANLSKLAGFGGSTYEDMNNYINDVETIVDKIVKLQNTKLFTNSPDTIKNLFEQLDFSKFTPITFSQVLDILISMPNRNSYKILENIFQLDLKITKDPKHMTMLADLIKNTHIRNLPSLTIAALIKIYPDYCKNITLSSELSAISKQFINIHERDNSDKLLAFASKTLDTNPSLSKDVISIINLSESIKPFRSDNNSKLAYLCTHLLNNNKLSELIHNYNLNNINEKNAKILLIIAKCHAVTNGKNRENESIYNNLSAELSKLAPDELDTVYNHCDITPASIDLLTDILQRRTAEQTIKQSLVNLEKWPFGKVNLDEHFDISKVEDVINNLYNMNVDSRYTYLRRKELMEAFLFVNDAGKELKIFNDKQASELTNQEIKDLFKGIKAGTIYKDQTPFQKRLLALALMRVAMYRSTGQQPTSTQMIAIIDNIMHDKDVGSNIDTGQGKSLIDIMKASLLWLEGGRVDITTSSLTDARRDIANYFSYLDFLGIPNSKSPITSESKFEDLLKDGINISTPAHLSLFYSRATVEGHRFNNKVSLVVGEIDNAILDDLVTYRYASTEDAPVPLGYEWIYYSINDFADRVFQNPKRQPRNKDIEDLRRFLKAAAKENHTKEELINGLEDKQLKKWLESAYKVKHQLKENEQYICTKEPVTKKFKGVEYQTKLIKVLDYKNDWRVMEGVQFGNGMHQLLCARKNKTKDNREFFIEPEASLMWSSNHKNLIDSYMLLNGYVWGSSGTVGSNEEIDEQHQDYGLEFTRIPSHHKKQVKELKPIEVKSETELLDLISKKLADKYPDGTPQEIIVPEIIYCEDIASVEEVYKRLASDPKFKDKIQKYTGIEDELEVINKAGKPGIVTISTMALGRNTDIKTDPTLGLNVTIAFAATPRKLGQMKGRTGRFGGKGEISQIYTEESSERLKEIIEVSRKARREGHKLYDIKFTLAKYVQEILTKLPEEPSIGIPPSSSASSTSTDVINAELKLNKQGLLQKWNEFIDEKVVPLIKKPDLKEKEIHSQISNLFIEDFAVLYKRYTGTELNVDSIFKEKEKRKAPEKFDVYEAPVKMADCIPTSIIAYNMLANDTGSNLNANEHSAKIKAIQNNDTKSYQDYFSYLLENKITKNDAAKDHIAHVTSLMTEETNKARNLSRLLRFIGYTSGIGTLTNNTQYLKLFKILTENVKDMKPEHQVVKDYVLALLDEHNATAWFIPNNTSKTFNELRKSIEKADSIDEIQSALGDAKIKAFETEIKSESLWYWNWTKSIFDPSIKFQNSLSSALNLTRALTKHPEDTVQGQESSKKEYNLEIQMLGLLSDTKFGDKVTFDTLMKATTDLSNQKDITHTKKLIINDVKKLLNPNKILYSIGMKKSNMTLV